MSVGGAATGWRRAALALLATLAGLACACGGADGEPSVVAELAAGDARLRLEEGPFSLVLGRGGDDLLRFGLDGFVLGVVDALDADANYDPYRLLVPDGLYGPLPGFAWVTADEARLVAAEPGEIAIALAYGGGAEQALVTARAMADGRFELGFASSGARAAVLRLAAHADASEGFYGLGEHFDAVNHRGKVRAMHLIAGGGLESGYNEAHVPVPFVTGTRGWGLFVESQYPGAFDLATSEPMLVGASFGTGASSQTGLRFHLFAAEHPLDVTRRYYDVTGHPRLPARSGLGPWIWRNEVSGQAAAAADLDAIRDLDLATTGYWIDRPYATEVQTFDFDPARYGDPSALFAQARDLGLLTALWHAPYLDEAAAGTAALVAEAEDKGFYPPVAGLPLNKWGRPFDFTNPAAVGYWREKLGGYLALGVAGFKLDYGEDIAPGLTNKRAVWTFADGSDERTMHAGYTLAYHATYAALLSPKGGFLLCRTGRYGDQIHGPIIWPGDLDASFAKSGEPGSDGGQNYVSVGGLPASVIAGLSLGPSGFPFYGSDTGGYRHAPPDKELFVRWLEQTALSTVMQVGTGSSDVPWEPTADNGFDGETLSLYRQYARLHLRLWPYLWTHATRLASGGRPIARALGLAYPELGVHPDDTYLLGDDLLVAPVVERGATSRTLSLPPGRWVHFWSGASYDGPATITVESPLAELPLFLRAGGIVPLLRPTIDALEPTADPARVDSYATDPGLLYVRAVAAEPGSFALFDGAALEERVEGSDSVLSFTAGSELVEGAIFELVAAAGPPAAVAVAGLPVAETSDLAALEALPGAGFFFDGPTHTLWVKVEPGAEARVTEP